MLQSLVRKYREIGISKVEAMFLAELIVANGKILESESTYTYNRSTINKIRASLNSKGLLRWTTKNVFGDVEYNYKLDSLKKALEIIEENKPKKADDLMKLFKEMTK